MICAITQTELEVRLWQKNQEMIDILICSDGDDIIKDKKTVRVSRGKDCLEYTKIDREEVDRDDFISNYLEKLINKHRAYESEPVEVVIR